MAEVDFMRVAKESDSIMRERIEFNNTSLTYNSYYGFFIPLESKLERLDFWSGEILRAYENAEHYRRAILDENLPLTGRLLMIESLGKIRYHPACPELREALLHDKEEYIRECSAFCLGEIRDKKYVPDLVCALRKEDNFSALVGIEMSLGDLKDSRALPALRERFEKVLWEVNQGNDVGLLELEMIIGSMMKIGGDLTSDTIDKLLSIPNPYFYPLLKRAAFGTKYHHRFSRKRIIIPRRSVKN